MHSWHEHELLPRSDKGGFDLISDVFAFGACGMPSQMQ
jgi:hypothetical protein